MKTLIFSSWLQLKESNYNAEETDEIIERLRAITNKLKMPDQSPIFAQMKLSGINLGLKISDFIKDTDEILNIRNITILKDKLDLFWKKYYQILPEGPNKEKFIRDKIIATSKLYDNNMTASIDEIIERLEAIADKLDMPDQRSFFIQIRSNDLKFGRLTMPSFIMKTNEILNEKDIPTLRDRVIYFVKNNLQFLPSGPNKEKFIRDATDSVNKLYYGIKKGFREFL